MKKLTTNEFIKKAKNLYGNKFNYSKTIYGKDNKENVIIICPIHGEFLQAPAYHLTNRGCYKCGIENSKKLQRNNLKDFIRNSIKIHDNLYDYSKVIYINAHTKVDIICKKHGIFSQKPNNHLNGRGCPICKFSKGELKVIKFLEENKIQYIIQKSFNDCRNIETNQKLKFDFYIPSKNLLIEYDGEQHFKIHCRLGGYTSNVKDLQSIQYRDKLKTQYAKNNQIKLLRIKYTKLNKIDQILESVLNA